MIHSPGIWVSNITSANKNFGYKFLSIKRFSLSIYSILIPIFSVNLDIILNCIKPAKCCEFLWNLAILFKVNILQLKKASKKNKILKLKLWITEEIKYKKKYDRMLFNEFQKEWNLTSNDAKLQFTGVTEKRYRTRSKNCKS